MEGINLYILANTESYLGGCRHPPAFTLPHPLQQPAQALSSNLEKTPALFSDKYEHVRLPVSARNTIRKQNYVEYDCLREIADEPARLARVLVLAMLYTSGKQTMDNTYTDNEIFKKKLIFASLPGRGLVLVRRVHAS